MSDSLDNQDTSVETQNVAVVDFGAFTNFLRKASTILLPEENVVPPEMITALEDKNHQDCIRKFLSDQQVQTLFVQRSCSKDEDNEHTPEGEEEKTSVAFYISNDVQFTNSRNTSLVCIKRGAVIEADKSIHSQVQLNNFPEGSPYENLHAFISKSMAPYFKSYVKESGRGDDGDKMAPSVEKKWLN